jgi:hypothetical protein
MSRGFGWPVLVSAAIAAGCDGATDTGDGRIRIEVTTSGSDPQTDEYLLTLDGGRQLSVPPNGSITYDGVPAGTHVVHLFAISDNCTVSNSESQRSVQVRSGDLSEIRFEVVCGPAVSGGFRITISTVGEPTDKDGLDLFVSGTPPREINANAEEVYEGLVPGVYQVRLGDVEDFCEVMGGNPQSHTVVAGTSVEVDIRVLCGSARGPH